MSSSVRVHEGQNGSMMAVGAMLWTRGIGRQNGLRQLGAADLPGDVARVEALDIVGEDAILVTYRPSREIHLALATRSLGFVDGGRGRGAGAHAGQITASTTDAGAGHLWSPEAAAAA